MNYLQTGQDYYVIELIGKKIVCKSGKMILNPTIKVRLLNFNELHKCTEMFGRGMNRVEVYDEIAIACIQQIIAFEEEEIDYELVDAGIIDSIAEKIFMESMALIEDFESTYNRILNSSIISNLDPIAAIVSYYLTIPFDTVINMPIDEIFKKYVICSLAFPQSVPPIQKTEELKPSKVG